MHLSLEEQAAFAEGLLPPESRKRAHTHLATCTACAAGVIDQLAVMQALHQLPPVPTGADGWAALATALQSPAQRPDPSRQPPAVRQWSWRRSRSWISAAAVMVAAIGLSTMLDRSPEPLQHELDGYWREHQLVTHQTAPSNSVAAWNLLTTTHRLHEAGL